MSKEGGTGVGAGSLTVPAPIKPASAVHEGALTDQPMNAATLALFARVTKLESDIRAARVTEQDQAALHGRLWAELVAAEVKVEAVPIATPKGASAAVRRSSHLVLGLDPGERKTGTDWSGSSVRLVMSS